MNTLYPHDRGRKLKMANVMPMMIAALIAGAPAMVSAQEVALQERLEAEQIYLQWDVSVDLGSAQEAFAEVLRSAERPGGTVTLSGCGEPARGPMYAPGQSSVASALYRLTAVYPGYYWTVQGGVIDLLPKQNQPPVMDVRVQRFEWDTRTAMRLSVENVFQVAAVKDRLAGLGVTDAPNGGFGLQRPPRVINGIPVPEPPPKGRKWQVENVTVLVALNVIAASYGTGFWHYDEWACGGRKVYSLSTR
jgi:hypothetical protein